MDKRNFLQMCALGAAVAPISALVACKPEAATTQVGSETSFERVVRTRTIRASYATYAPAFMIDPNTQKKTGIFFDMMNMVGDRLGYKVEWMSEVGWGEIAEGFKTGRYDVCAANVWPTAPRAVQGNFSMPSYYSAAIAFIRKDERRIRNFDDINQSGIRIIAQDGDGITDIARAHFPRAKLLLLPQSVDTKQRLMDVAAGKADVTFDDSYYGQLYLDKNPGLLRRLEASKPLQVFPNTMMFDNDDWRMKLLLDTAMSELHNSGMVDRLVQKYTGANDTFLPLAKPYEARA